MKRTKTFVGMRPKKAIADPLIVLRGQPLHVGHIRVIDTALKEHDRVFIVLGSVQEYGTSRNPFTLSERKQMIRNYYSQHITSYTPNMALKGMSDWDRIRVLGLPDINNPIAWPDYVIDSIKKEFPDADLQYVYGGTEHDCNWFMKHELNPVVVHRANQVFPFVSGAMVRDMLTYSDLRWKGYIPKCNWQTVAAKFNRLDMLD